ncbi:type IV pilin protein [Pseudoxanthomonas sp.]|uniref:type IV pilin protein n=1 Tax=Pseudoxanthomonas sp. TaxID=1871049 RepID=UPI0028C4DF35|nr:type IV pilin protein [Pseudoxanthomonas sp.]
MSVFCEHRRRAVNVERRPSSAESGFTLIELMIVVAVIAILAAIAYPSYLEYVIKSRRTAAAACLQQHAQVMERYFTTNLTYVGAPGPVCDAAVPQFYNVGFSGAAAARAYVLQAVPTGSQNDPRCGTLTINAQGVRTKSGTGTLAACW